MFISYRRISIYIKDNLLVTLEMWMFLFNRHEIAAKIRANELVRRRTEFLRHNLISSLHQIWSLMLRDFSLSGHSIVSLQRETEEVLHIQPEKTNKTNVRNRASFAKRNDQQWNFPPYKFMLICTQTLNFRIKVFLKTNLCLAYICVTLKLVEV